MCHLCWGLTHQRSFLKWTKRKCLDWLSTQTTWSLYGLLDREPWEWKQNQGVHTQIWSIFARSSNIAGNSFFRIQGGQLLVSTINCHVKSSSSISFLWHLNVWHLSAASLLCSMISHISTVDVDQQLRLWSCNLDRAIQLSHPSEWGTVTPCRYVLL